MSDILDGIDNFLAFESNNYSHHSPSLQRRLEEANLANAQLKKENLYIVLHNEQLRKQKDDCISLLRELAQEQIHRQDELNDLRTLLANTTMNLQHEYECHRKTGENLEHERDLVKYASYRDEVKYIREFH